MVTFLFSVHTITEAKQYAGIDRAEPGWWIFVARSGVTPLPLICFCQVPFSLATDINYYVLRPQLGSYEV